jgi:peptide/nickel transport system permease protein
VQASYVLRRVALTLLIIWIAATLNFFLPALSGRGTIRARPRDQAAQNTNAQPARQSAVAGPSSRLDLAGTKVRQYVSYLARLSHGDLSYAGAGYPRKVTDLIREALPWTVGLLTVTTLCSWVIGSLLGAAVGWRRAPRTLRYLMPPLIALHAIPFFLLGLVLLDLFAFRIRLFPLMGGYSAEASPGFSISFLLDLLYHALLPALSIILVSIGGWALGMRAMLVTIREDDFIVYADANGLRGRTLFLRYAVRNALLPQTTALALALGQIVSGALFVEAVYSYPGIGTLLYHAIRSDDYATVQGVVITIVVSLSVATLALDLVYPLIDPRVTYRRA